MQLALFDLDNTLLSGDSDHAWGDFLCQKGILDKEAYKKQNDLFYQQYLAKTLDIQQYLHFCLAVLNKINMPQLKQLQYQFMQEIIEPMISTKAEALLTKHRQQGHTLIIITATNRFVTEPIAKRLGVNHLIATDCEIKEGHYTGKPLGTPCFQEGKIIKLNEWLNIHHATLKESFFYSDSINDLPLLSIVDHPIVVNPDNLLKTHAEKQQWPIISLQN